MNCYSQSHCDFDTVSMNFQIQQIKFFFQLLAIYTVIVTFMAFTAIRQYKKSEYEDFFQTYYGWAVQMQTLWLKTLPHASFPISAFMREITYFVLDMQIAAIAACYGVCIAFQLKMWCM